MSIWKSKTNRATEQSSNRRVIMQVVKRSGVKEDVDASKITKRVADLVTAPTHLEHVDPSAVAVRVVAGLHDGVTTAALDELAVETAAHFAT